MNCFCNIFTTILLKTAFFHRPKNQKSSDAIEGIGTFVDKFGG